MTFKPACSHSSISSMLLIWLYTQKGLLKYHNAIVSLTHAVAKYQIENDKLQVNLPQRQKTHPSHIFFGKIIKILVMSAILLQYNSSEDLVIYQQSKIRCKTFLSKIYWSIQFCFFIGWFPSLIQIFFNLVLEIMEEVHCMEQFFIKLHTIYAFVCQVSLF